MQKIGHVDMGTTHPLNFIKAEKELGFLPYALFDDFRITGSSELETLAAQYDMKIFTSLEEMASEVDVAFIHSVNWDIHFEKILPFVKKGKGIFIDKPVCGCIEDINRISELSRQGARISGGSMLVYSDEIQQLHRDESDFVKGINLVFAGGPNDVFYYGIHVFYMVCGVLGFDIASVRYIGENIQKLIEITWESGQKAVLAIGDTKKYFRFHMTLVTSDGTKQYSIKGFEALRNMLRKVIPHLAGQSMEIPAIEKLLNCEKAALAALQSEKSGGKAILLSKLDNDLKYDGAAYEAVYKKVKTKQ